MKNLFSKATKVQAANDRLQTTEDLNVPGMTALKVIYIIFMIYYGVWMLYTLVVSYITLQQYKKRKDESVEQDIKRMMSEVDQDIEKMM